MILPPPKRRCGGALESTPNCLVPTPCRWPGLDGTGGSRSSNQGRFGRSRKLFRRASPIIEASVNADARAQLSSYLRARRRQSTRFCQGTALCPPGRQPKEGRKLKAANGDTGLDFRDCPQSQRRAGPFAAGSRPRWRCGSDDLPNAQAAAEEALWIVNLEARSGAWWRADVLSLIAEVNERRGRTGRSGNATTSMRSSCG